MRALNGARLAAAALMLLAAHPSIQAGYLYVLNTDSSGNMIYGFEVDEIAGELSTLPGSPWATTATRAQYRDPDRPAAPRSGRSAAA